jgi:opacity protein-like surface antigen
LINKFVFLILFLPSMSTATTNLISLNIGRGTPESSIQATGSSDLNGASGQAWSFDAFHLVSPQVYLGLSTGHFSAGDNTSLTFVPNTTTTISSKVTSSLILGRLDLTPGGKAVPYLIGGIGWAKNSIVVTSDSVTLVNDSKNTFEYGVGGGIDFAWTDHLFIGAEGRYQGSYKSSYNMTQEGVAATGRNSLSTGNTVLIFTVRAGVMY